jgi:hypothetical protein
VLELEGQAAASARHIGDHRVADGTMARRSGIEVVLCDEPALNRYEAALERHATGTAGVASLLAGTARVVRTTRDAPDGRRALREVAASVAAPVLIGFVAWTLETARRAGCTRIGYVSRDGQLLHAVAARLESGRDPDARLVAEYVHGGRRAWHPAGLTPDLLDGEPPPWWLEEARRRRWQAPLDILGLDEAAVPAGATAALRDAWSSPPGGRSWQDTVRARQEALHALWRDPAMHAALVDAGATSRSLLCRYLAERSMGSDRWALVDVGWRGYSAASLNRALRHESLMPPLHLYLGLRDPDVELTSTGDWQTYLFCTPGPDARAGRFGGALTTFIEAVCSADHGSVAGFRESDSGVVPVLDPPHLAAQEWGIDEVQATILEVAERVAPFATEIAAHDPRDALHDVVALFLDAPDRDEVDAWATFPFTDDPAGVTATDWVARWSSGDLARWALRGIEPRSFWPQASLALSPRPTRALLAARRRAARGRQGRAGGDRAG